MRTKEDLNDFELLFDELLEIELMYINDSIIDKYEWDNDLGWGKIIHYSQLGGQHYKRLLFQNKTIKQFNRLIEELNRIDQEPKQTDVSEEDNNQ